MPYLIRLSGPAIPEGGAYFIGRVDVSTHGEWLPHIVSLRPDHAVALQHARRFHDAMKTLAVAEALASLGPAGLVARVTSIEQEMAR